MRPPANAPVADASPVEGAPDSPLPLIRHASTVAFGPHGGVAISGPAGSGKSTMALALITLGARLVADDRTVTWAGDGALFARAPGAIAGLLERRGIGLLRLPPLRLARLCLVIDLSSPQTQRLPEPRQMTWQGVTLPCLRAPEATSGLAPTFPAAVQRYMQESEERCGRGGAMKGR